MGGPGGNTVSEGLFHCAADGAAQLPRTVGRYFVPCQRFGSGSGMAQRVALCGGALFQFAQQPVGNALQLCRAERVKQNRLVQTAHQFGTEKFFCLLHGLLAAAESIAYFAALIAVNLAVMNLLPLPALDGGRIFFLLVDAVSMALFKRKVPEKYQAAINTAGFVLLMGFMLLVTFQDVFKLVK